MPELPEVEAARLLAADHLVGRTLTAVRAADDAKLFGPAAGKDFSAALVGRTLTAACRHGKNLWLEFGGGKGGKGGKGPPISLALHFGMTGSLAVRGAGQVQYVNARTVDQASWPPPFTKLELDFEGAPPALAAYADPRRFGKVRLATDPRAGLPAGRDILTDPPTVAEFGAALARAGSKKVKPLLMDQAFLAGASVGAGCVPLLKPALSLICPLLHSPTLSLSLPPGIGNWVADEALWLARIHPEAAAAALSDAQVSALLAALSTVVMTAVAARADS